MARAGAAESRGLVRPRMRHGGVGRVPVRTIKTTTISILALGLLAGSAVGVAAQEDETDVSTPAYVTWEVTGDAINVIDGAFDEEAAEMRGLTVQGVPIEASDPRMSGLYYYVVNGNGQKLSTPDYGIVESRSWRMENDGGAWTGTTTWVQVGSGSDGPQAMTAEAGILIGEGGYEGLIAVIDSDYDPGRAPKGEAVILERSVPPFPEVPEVPAE